MKVDEVVLVRFPFTDPGTAKKRTALVLVHTARSPRYRFITMAMITSQIEALKLDGEVLLETGRLPDFCAPACFDSQKSLPLI